MDPAAERVVPTALKTAEGVGWSFESRVAHCEVLGSRRDSRLDEVGDDWARLGNLREMVLIEVKKAELWSSSKVLRMWLPTAPVLPNTAAVVMFRKMGGVECWAGDNFDD